MAKIFLPNELGPREQDYGQQSSNTADPSTVTSQGPATDSNTDPLTGEPYPAGTMFGGGAGTVEPPTQPADSGNPPDAGGGTPSPDPGPGPDPGGSPEEPGPPGPPVLPPPPMPSAATPLAAGTFALPGTAGAKGFGVPTFGPTNRSLRFGPGAPLAGTGGAFGGTFGAGGGGEGGIGTEGNPGSGESAQELLQRLMAATRG